MIRRNFLVALGAAAVLQTSFAATIQGTLVRKTMAGVQPAGNIAVTLRGTSAGKEVHSGRVFSDLDGQFWFYDIPNGAYTLEIWRNGHGVGQPEKCLVQVAAAEVSVGKPLRLQSSRARTNPPTKSCSAGLEHLYQ